MRDLGVEDAICIKELDAGIRCAWNFAWLNLKCHVEVKGEDRAFPLSDVFKKIDKSGHVRCVLCHKEINYGSKGSHALLAHCKTDIHKKKVCDLLGTHSIASLLSSEAGPSTSAPKQGPENIRQQCQAKLPTPIVNRIANSEVGIDLSAQHKQRHQHHSHNLICVLVHNLKCIFCCCRPWFLEC